MIINKFNIDKWLFDYFEGNLSPHEEVEVELFLSQNPEFEVDFDTWQDSLNTEIDVPTYDAPKSLYKKEFTYEKWLIASVFLLLLGSGVYLSTLKNWKSSELAIRTVHANQFGNKSDKRNTPKSMTDKRESYQQITSSSKGLINILPSSISSNGSNEKITNPNSNSSSPQPKKKQLPSSFTSYLNWHPTTTKKRVHNIQKNYIMTENKTSVKRKREVKLDHNSIAFFDAKRSIKKITHSKRNHTVEPFIFNESSEIKRNKFSYLEFERKRKVKKRKKSKDKIEKHEKEEREGNEIDWDIYKIHLASEKKGNRRNNLRSKIARLSHQELALHNTHDPIFLLTNNNPLNVNFALAGGLEMHRLKSNYLNQWSGSANPLTTITAAYDTYIEGINAGVGLISSYNQLANLNTNWLKIGAVYSQRINLGSERSLSMALKYEYEQVNTEVTSSNSEQPIEITQGKLISPLSFSQNKGSYNHSQFSSAFWYDGKFFYGGLSINKIFATKNLNNNAKQFAEYINPVKFAIQLGTDYRRSSFSPLVVSPQINYISYGSTGVLWLGTTVKYRNLIAGIGGTFSNNYKINVGTQGKRLRLMYGFSYAKSFAENRFLGTHEISLRYLIRSGNWKKK